MAKLKEKINDLKTKYGITEEAAREVLALHDGDLAESNAMLTAEQNKVVEWNKFWFEKSPQIEALAQEYDKLRTQMETLQRAGVNFGQAQAQPQVQAPVAQAQSTDELEAKIYRNFSAVQEDLYNIQKYHLDNYKSLPDITPIKKLIEDKKLTPWAAYQEWVAPMEATRKEDALREKITKELTEKFQNEATRSGVNSYLLSNKNSVTGEEVTSPLDEDLRERIESAQKAAVAAQAANKSADGRQDPSDFENMVDFVNSMRTGRAAGH